MDPVKPKYPQLVKQVLALILAGVIHVSEGTIPFDLLNRIERLVSIPRLSFISDEDFAAAVKKAHALSKSLVSVSRSLFASDKYFDTEIKGIRASSNSSICVSASSILKAKVIEIAKRAVERTPPEYLKASESTFLLMVARCQDQFTIAMIKGLMRKVSNYDNFDTLLEKGLSIETKVMKATGLDIGQMTILIDTICSGKLDHICNVIPTVVGVEDIVDQCSAGIGHIKDMLNPDRVIKPFDGLDQLSDNELLVGFITNRVSLGYNTLEDLAFALRWFVEML